MKKINNGSIWQTPGNDVLKIAICGNIASGKTAVQHILEGKGYKVLDTDVVSHALLTVKNKKLFEAFKDYDVFEDREFSRQKTGRLIFNDENARKLLGSVIHPQIAAEIRKFYEKNKPEKAVFVGIPLLFEAKMEDLFDKIIFVYTDDKIRLERLIKRNNYTIEHAKARMNSQMPQDEKIKKSDYVIENNGSIEDLKIRVENILSIIIL